MEFINTSASHPVLGEIQNLLVTKHENPLESGFLQCLGVSRVDPKVGHLHSGEACGVDLSKKKKGEAQRLINSFRVQTEIIYSEDFYEQVEKFLDNSHCRYYHKQPALDKFTTWKDATSRTTATVVANEAPLFTDHTSTEQELDLSSCTELPSAATPQRMPRDLAYADEDTISDDLSSLTISPSQESEISFASVSEAGTALTTPERTPAATPLSDDDDPILAYDAELRPETPTPGPRHAKYHIVDNDLDVHEDEDENKEVVKVLNKHQDQAPEVRDSQLRRFMSQKPGKKRLLCAIEDRFGKLEYVPGKVYVWRNDSADGVIKIGWTRDGRTPRHNPSNCYSINTTPVWKSPAAFAGSYRVERIVQNQLLQQRVRNLRCGDPECTTQHREWFEYGLEDAITLIETWTKFVLLPAYVDGVLSDKGREVMDRICNFEPDRVLLMMEEPTAGQSSVSEPEVVNRVVTIREEAERSGSVHTTEGNSSEEERHQEPIRNEDSTTDTTTVGYGPVEEVASGANKKIGKVRKSLGNAVTWTRKVFHQAKSQNDFESGHDEEEEVDMDTIVESFYVQYYAVELKQVKGGSKSSLRSRLKKVWRSL